MPTTNPVPSTDPTDLLFNAQKLDQIVNGAANSFTDRLGVARRTVAGMNADFDAQLADAESDLNVYRSDAAASAAEALGYLQTIRATSYGAYASDPATDPLGNPPTVGDEYFNTTANLLKRWNGTTWQASDINTANLAASSGSSLVGYDGGTVQDVLDSSKPMANYTALRNYTGRATAVRITQVGLSGFFYRDDADITSADNSGTIIVDGSGRRWKRLFDGDVNVKWFGAYLNSATDDRQAFVLADAYAYANNKSLKVPGIAHIATPLTLNALLVDTTNQIFTVTSQVTVSNKFCVRPEWWGARQNAESTTAINRAIQSIINGAILRLSGFYQISGNGAQCLLIDRPATIQGIGAPRSGFVVLNGAIGASTDVIRISPDMTKSDGEGYSLFDFGVSTVTPTDGRHAINLDISAAGQRLKNLYIHRVQTTRVGGKGVYVTNPIPNTESVFTTSIRDCVIRNGIYLINAGDSIRIEDNTLTGENYGVWLQLVIGANAPLISGNNITNKSGAAYVYGPTNPIIVYNNIEALSKNDTAEDAFIVLNGENAGAGPLVNPPRKAVIEGNIFGMLDDAGVPRVTRGVYMYQGDGCEIDKNQFNRAVPASQLAYVIGSLCRGTVIGTNTISGATHQEGYTDLGQGTIGTVRVLDAYNTGYAFYTSAGNVQSPRYTKDANQVVTLSGGIQLNGGTWTDGAAIFTLPLGYRPRLLKRFPVTAFQTSVGYITVFMEIAGNGTVSLRGVTGKTIEWVMYDGVTFMNYEL